MQSSSTHTPFPQSVLGRRFLIYLIRGEIEAISQPFSSANKVRSVCSRDWCTAGGWGELCLNEEVGTATSSTADACFCCTQHEAAKSSRCQSSQYKHYLFGRFFLCTSFRQTRPKSNSRPRSLFIGFFFITIIIISQKKSSSCPANCVI